MFGLLLKSNLLPRIIPQSGHTAASDQRFIFLSESQTWKWEKKKFWQNVKSNAISLKKLFFINSRFRANKTYKNLSEGSASSTVGRAVASCSRDPRFKSNDWYFCIDCQLYWKDAMDVPSFKKKKCFWIIAVPKFVCHVLFLEQRNRFLPRYYNQCDQIWRNFATLAKSSKSLAIFRGSIYYLAKFWAYFGLFCLLLVKFSFMSLDQMWKNNLAIWSQWLQLPCKEPYLVRHCVVVVAQLEERSRPTPEVCSSRPVIGRIYIERLFTVNCIYKHNKKGQGFRLTVQLRRNLWPVKSSSLDTPLP